MGHVEQHPPKWADRFLEWYCNPELLEEIQGDLYERFYERLEQKGIKNARFGFVWNVLRFINKYTLRHRRRSSYFLNLPDMFKSYLKTGF